LSIVHIRENLGPTYNFNYLLSQLGARGVMMGARGVNDGVRGN